MKRYCSYVSVLLVMVATAAMAAIKVPMYYTAAQGQGKFIGNIVIEENPYGLVFTPHLKDIPQGEHGFHIHVTPNCGRNGLDADGHFDPGHTRKHKGPFGEGHRGDLPVLYADSENMVTTPVLAPRLKRKDVYEHALMIHVDGDNYSDYPRKLGGGGARLACGVVHQS